MPAVLVTGPTAMQKSLFLPQLCVMSPCDMTRG